MYRTAPPDTSRTNGALPLRLRRLVHRRFAVGGGWTDDPELHRYYADLASLHGVGYRGEVLRRGAGNTFVGMAGPMLAGVDRVDVLIVAHATPDLDPRVSAGSGAAHRFAGEPLVFTVMDQACSAAFTAIRLAGEYVRRHSYRRALVLVLDQSTLPYESSEELGGDAAVALHFDFDPDGRVRSGRVPGVAPEEVARVADRIGGGVPVIGLGQPDRRFPATGIWRAYQPGAGAVLVHYDQSRAQLSYCAVDANEAP
jgi:hypothetical protein